VKKAAAAIASLFMAFPATAPAASTSEFLSHCEATPEPCKEKVLAYVKFLADEGLLDQCVSRCYGKTHRLDAWPSRISWQGLGWLPRRCHRCAQAV